MEKNTQANMPCETLDRRKKEIRYRNGHVLWIRNDDSIIYIAWKQQYAGVSALLFLVILIDFSWSVFDIFNKIPLDVLPQERRDFIASELELGIFCIQP